MIYRTLAIVSLAVYAAQAQEIPYPQALDGAAVAESRLFRSQSRVAHRWKRRSQWTSVAAERRSVHPRGQERHLGRADRHLGRSGNAEGRRDGPGMARGRNPASWGKAVPQPALRGRRADRQRRRRGMEFASAPAARARMERTAAMQESCRSKESPATRPGINSRSRRIPANSTGSSSISPAPRGAGTYITLYAGKHAAESGWKDSPQAEEAVSLESPKGEAITRVLIYVMITKGRLPRTASGRSRSRAKAPYWCLLRGPRRRKRSRPASILPARQRRRVRRTCECSRGVMPS